MTAEQPAERKSRMFKALLPLCSPCWFVISVIQGMRRRPLYTVPNLFSSLLSVSDSHFITIAS